MGKFGIKMFFDWDNERNPRSTNTLNAIIFTEIFYLNDDNVSSWVSFNCETAKINSTEKRITAMCCIIIDRYI